LTSFEWWTRKVSSIKYFSQPLLVVAVEITLRPSRGG
jgi:hypothetical protein